MGLEVGVALWTMQSTAAGPAHPAALYRRLVRQACRVEELGFASLWLAEHRAWYDGWCPAPVVAAAAAAAATTRLRFGTAMLLLPQADPLRLAESVATLDRLSGGRLDLGVGLGHRDAEFDLLGIARRARGRRMGDALDVLLDAWSDRPLEHAGDHFGYRRREVLPKPAQRPHPRVWVGGLAPEALRRAARRGLSYLLPQTMYPQEVTGTVELIRAAAAEAGRPVGRIGMLKDVWVCSGRDEREAFLRRLRAHYTEESGAWWILKGAFTGFERRDLLDRQLDRITDTALVGGPETVAAGLRGLAAAGLDLVTLRANFDVVGPAELDRTLRLLADEVLPAVGNR